MAGGAIYLVDGDGLRRMSPSAPENEDRMQQLVAQYPELISDGDGDLLLIQREQRIGDGVSDGRWSIDHLFVTRGAVPVLVELKRAVDTRLRREVVGQMLDYAANASTHWESGTLAASFAVTVGIENAESALADFIGDQDQDAFWGQVESNLRSGRIKLVFVADQIPRELAVVAEFLNSQMRADVRAIELQWFSDKEGLTTLVPRVIGESIREDSAKAGRSMSSMSVAEWIDKNLLRHGPDTIAGVEKFMAIVAETDGQCVVPSTAGSIVAQWPAHDGRFAYAFGVYPSGKIVLRLGYLKYRARFADEAARQSLYDKLSDIVGALHTRSLNGDPGFDAALLLSPKVVEGFRAFVAETVETARQS